MALLVSALELSRDAPPPVTYIYAMRKKGREFRHGTRGFVGWEVAHAGRYATPADTWWYPVPRATRTALGFGVVHRPRAVFCRAAPSLNVSFRLATCA
jgi:hypothetical protein